MNTPDSLQCWRCGASLVEEPLPLARAAVCSACGADLHCCRLCAFHDRSVANECRETVAERVIDKTRANFCGYFTPRPAAHEPAAPTASTGALAALFGLDPPRQQTTPDAHARALDDLFKKPG